MQLRLDIQARLFVACCNCAWHSLHPSRVLELHPCAAKGSKPYRMPYNLRDFLFFCVMCACCQAYPFGTQSAEQLDSSTDSSFQDPSHAPDTSATSCNPATQYPRNLLQLKESSASTSGWKLADDEEHMLVRFERFKRSCSALHLPLRSTTAYTATAFVTDT